MPRSMQQRTLQRALRAGAEQAVLFDVNNIIFDPRTLLKCMFGCQDFGFKHTCPSNPKRLRPPDYEPLLKTYQWGVIIATLANTECQRIALDLEYWALRNGYHFAFSLSDCTLCDICAGFSSAPCRHPQRARPPLHSVGIDVFKTIERLGLPHQSMPFEDQTPIWYGAVFVE